MKRVAVVFSRFGPYHVARLEGAGRLLGKHGQQMDVVFCPVSSFSSLSVLPKSGPHPPAVPRGRVRSVKRQPPRASWFPTSTRSCRPVEGA